jgi:hypothetical protein
MEYGAIDLHTRQCEVQIVNEAGVVVFARRVVTRPDALRAVLIARARMRILLEAGTESEWQRARIEG